MSYFQDFQIFSYFTSQISSMKFEKFSKTFMFRRTFFEFHFIFLNFQVSIKKNRVSGFPVLLPRFHFFFFCAGNERTAGRHSPEGYLEHLFSICRHFFDLNCSKHFVDTILFNNFLKTTCI